MTAQALALRRAVPGTGTIDIVSCRARVVFFRIVLVPTHRAHAKWPGIGWHDGPEGRGTGFGGGARQPRDLPGQPGLLDDGGCVAGCHYQSRVLYRQPLRLVSDWSAL
jgi:hypothetical protein